MVLGHSLRTAVFESLQIRRPHVLYEKIMEFHDKSTEIRKKSIFQEMLMELDEKLTRILPENRCVPCYENWKSVQSVNNGFVLKFCACPQ